MERPDRALIAWRKSTYSGSTGGDCVEVGGAADSVLVRDTKNRDGATMDIPAAAWRSFVAASN